MIASFFEQEDKALMEHTRFIDDSLHYLMETFLRLLDFIKEDQDSSLKYLYTVMKTMNEGFQIMDKVYSKYSEERL